jgi:hypothetical protein
MLPMSGVHRDEHMSDADAREWNCVCCVWGARRDCK